MIIDAFLFCQEYDMLEFRLRLLYDHVDKFIIIEADKTFSGLDKPFNFEQHRTKYSWAEDKIRYFKFHCNTSNLNLADKPTDFQPNHDCWQIEYAQRNAIVTACEGFADDDILIMGDVDEIPSREAIEWAKQNIRRLPVVCQQHVFYYNLRHLRQEMHLTSIFSTLRTARSLGAQELRNRRGVLTRIANSGWHLSYFDDAERIKYKIESFSHQELNHQKFKDDEHINRCIETGNDLFKRGVKSEVVHSGFFPSYFIEKASLFNWGLDAQSGARKAIVSLTMIVRNEEHNLSRCLDSVQDIFDEIIVVDTGSTDTTKEIAAKYQAKIVDFIWADDFSAARNTALSHASGDYVFWLDADDVLQPSEKEKLEALLGSLYVGQKAAYVLRCASDREGDSQIVVDHVRLFPRLPGVQWTYRVHEQILPSLLNAGVQVLWTDIVVLHKGYMDAGVKERKRQRDWDILTRELTAAPGDPFVLYNLGMIAFEREQWLEALEYFNRSFAGVPKTTFLEPLRRKLFAMRAWTYQILGQLLESLRVCEEGLGVDQKDAELWFRKAVAYRYLRKTVEAEACWRHILGLRRPDKFCSIDQGIYGHLTRRNLAIIAGERGDHKEAQLQWRAVLEECPGDVDALRHIESEMV